MVQTLRFLSLAFLTYHLALYFPQLANPLFLLLSCLVGFLLAHALRKIHPLLALVTVFAGLPLALKTIVDLCLKLLATLPQGYWDFIPLWIDRQLVFSLLPYALSYLSTALVLTQKSFLPWERLWNALLLVALFWGQNQHQLAFYPYPFLLALALGIYLAFELSILYLYQLRKFPLPALRQRVFLRVKVFMLSGSGLLLLLIVGVLWGLLRGFEETSSKGMGGLLKRDLMKFDFSRLIRLENDISLTEELLLLYREEGAPKQHYLRRFILSGYHPDKGFFVNPGADRQDEEVISVGRQTLNFSDHVSPFHRVFQEYYLVNLDPSSLVALHQPVRVQPYAKWDNSSFVNAYNVVSHLWAGSILDLTRVTSSGLSEEQKNYYLDYGNSEHLRKFALEITQGATTYLEQVLRVRDYLKENYFYSLKPGNASDGDQLKYFLFERRQGYCSYFAFAMSLLLRSLGIPTRVCVGFLTDPNAAEMNFYPVRAYMAHAWVEVAFKEAGWLAFDPTSQELALGEEFVQPQNLEKLSQMISEIIKNPKKPIDEPPSETEKTYKQVTRLLQKSLEKLISFWPFLVITLLLGTLSFWRFRYQLATFFVKDPRRCVYLGFKALQMRLRPLGLAAFKGQTPTEYKKNAQNWGLDLDEAVSLAEQARYSSIFTVQQAQKALKKIARIRPGLTLKQKIVHFFLPWIIQKSSPIRQGSSQNLVLFWFLMVLGWISPSFLTAETLGHYLDKARQAQKQENYQNAIQFYEEAQKKYPQSSEPSQHLGDLYRSQGLSQLALEQYKDVWNKRPENSFSWLNLAETYAALNQDQNALKTFQEAVEKFPYSCELVQALAWMYFRMEEFHKGIALLEDYVRYKGSNQTIEMTLGTLYSNLYEYDASRYHYQHSIEIAQGEHLDTSVFQSIAWYNLSLLEGSFYQFEKALQAVQNSLKTTERASGFLALGELYQSRLEFAKAKEAFEKARQTDNTPLSLLNLAELYYKLGFLDEASAIAHQVKTYKDESWIYHYGITKTKFQKELHQLYRDIYSAQAKKARFDRKVTIWEGFLNLIKRASFQFHAWHHDQISKSLIVELSQDSLRVKNSNEAWTNLMLAHRDQPSVGLKYLKLLANYQLPKNPLARPSLLKEEGILRRDIALLKSALDSFIPVWQNEEMIETLQEMLKLSDKTDQEQWYGWLEKLYQLNPAALLPCGFSLPVEASVYGPNEKLNTGWKKDLHALVKQTGWDAVFSHRKAVNFHFSLQCGPEKMVVWSLKDATGTTIKQGNSQVEPDKRQAWLNHVFQNIHQL